MEFVLGIIAEHKTDMEVYWVGFALETNAMKQVQYQTMLTKYRNMREKLLPKGSTPSTSRTPLNVSHSEHERFDRPCDSSKTGPHHTALASSNISSEWNAVMTFEVK
jgi:hypothetical protein